VGILNGSAAQQYVEKRWGDRVGVVSFDGVTQALEKLTQGDLDATVQDGPAWSFYGGRYKQLKTVGGPAGPGYYVLYLRPGDERLRDELSAGLLDLIRSDQLRALYQRYGIWNDTQKDLGKTGLGQEISSETSSQEGPGSASQGEPLLGWEAVQRNLPL